MTHNYLRHITLSTGHTRRSPRAEVLPGTTKALRPWLAACIKHVDDYPLPGPLGTLHGFVMQANVRDGALICHVGQMQAGPLVTFGIAARSRQSGELWAWLCAQYGSVNTMTAPSTPWCAVHLHPAYTEQQGMSAWVGDFERCVAWTWLDHPAP
jgi:hypothetical protein